MAEKESNQLMLVNATYIKSTAFVTGCW